MPIQKTSVSGRTPNVQHHLDIDCLDTVVQGYFAAALAASTHKTLEMQQYIDISCIVSL